jgi:NAD+ synthase (glutamine-hydrolysing)
MNMDINKKIRFGLAQINVCVGDFEGNKLKILEYILEAKKKQIDVLLFPECAICGYPPEDLLLKKGFLLKNLQTLDEISKSVNGINIVLGFVDNVDGKIYNAVAVIADGKIVGKYYKNILPNYGVFDEKRYFTAGIKNLICNIGNINFSLSICEDIWTDDTICEATKNVDLILNLSASPYHLDKSHIRKSVIHNYSKNTDATILYCNLVGGQDELVFDGNSFVMDKNGNILALADKFEEQILIFDQPNESLKIKKNIEPKIDVSLNIFCAQKQELVISQTPEYSQYAELYKALVLGTRDYVKKNGFQKVLIGLSGGIDSAIVAVIAVDALGKDNVICVSMPSVYSSNDTKKDAEVLAENLGLEFHTIPIENLRNSFNNLFEEIFKGLPKDTTEENIQARIRGNILMAMSNKFGALVLTTGNKSEIATGYCTLYGDMAGGFAVIKDVPKTMIFELSKYVNKIKNYELIPNSIISRPPTAELRENQKDEDSLPPYPVLDKILELYIEQDESLDNIVKKLGYEKSLVEKIIKLVDFNEYKRRQGAIGIKITPKAFGRDRRLPITNKFRDI